MLVRQCEESIPSDRLIGPFASMDDVPWQYILGTEVDVYSIHEAFAEASQPNRHAAAAAVCGAACGFAPDSQLAA